ncbi:spore protease YyaC [Lottiidibacillus patelloidae]|uniref:Spore protease YyaC n=1 Tax=Lottiidibacillus patelloidae TaxID=2670334 RepID=A0A263BTR5_9BACI|nr:spore protease YyaC [Lottiidibacillus patelloidae]OZM56576.1 spore protease YyaC [Lottiidibacillus patelloidae]
MNFKDKFIRRKPDTQKVHYEENKSSIAVANALFSLISSKHKKNIVFVCIGTDRSTGDSLGPLVGTKLKQKSVIPYHVYGTLEQPIHAVNLEESYKKIKEKHPTAIIIAIDACLGRFKSVGYITIGKGAIKPGAGVHKTLPSVGDIYINGIVNISGMMEYFVLQNTRLHLVMSMADVISEGIQQAWLMHEQQIQQNEIPSLSAINKRLKE